MNYTVEDEHEHWLENNNIALTLLTIIAIVALPAALEPVSWNTADVTVHPTKTEPSNTSVSALLNPIRTGELTQQHSSITDQEQLPPSNAVDEQRARKRHEEIEDLQASVDERLGSRFRYADRLSTQNKEERRRLAPSKRLNGTRKGLLPQGKGWVGGKTSPQRI